MLLRFLLVSVAASLGMDAPSASRMDCWTCQARTFWDAHACVVKAPAEIAPPAAEVVVAAPEAPAAIVAEAVAPMPDDSAAFVAETAAPTPAEAPTALAEAVAPMPDDSAAFVAEPAPIEPVVEEVAEVQVEEFIAPMPDSVAAFVGEPVEIMPAGLDAFVAEPASAVADDAEALAAAEAFQRLADEGFSFDALIETLDVQPVEDQYPELVLESPVEETTPGSRIEVLDEQPEIAEAPAPAPAKDAKLTEAVRLTRQALRAWVGVLNAPAVVSAGR